ncbi:hypothetical protein VKT23_009190 [Stygiomarasmius scandens]|uniref:Uncharacterized protein n=1 Tax=Marasmiellus scandens TaxID=2682957 RepID=A0ABR1JKP2_9AGAR
MALSIQEIHINLARAPALATAFGNRFPDADSDEDAPQLTEDLDALTVINDVDHDLSKTQVRRPSSKLYTSSQGVDLASYADRLRASSPSPDQNSPMPSSLFSSRSSTASCKSGITPSSQHSYPYPKSLMSSSGPSSLTGRGRTSELRPISNAIAEMTRVKSVPDGYGYVRKDM